MHIPQDFIPDFTCKTTTGALCNRHSIVQYKDSKCYVSLNNRLNLWDLNSTELLKSFGTRSYRVTSFYVSEHYLFIGYEDGSIEIIRNNDFNNNQLIELNESTILKIHPKRVSKIIVMDDRMISASTGGTICCYDLLLSEMLHYFKGNSASVENLVPLNNSKFCAVCGDKSIKIWNVDSEAIEDAIAFDGYVFDAVIKGEEALVFLKTGSSHFVNLSDKSMRPFEKFRNIRNVRLKSNILCIQCQRKTSIFESMKENSLGLHLLKRFESSTDYSNFDLVGKDPCFISLSNRIVLGNNIYTFGFHENDVTGIKIEKSRIYSLSKDKIVVWERMVDNLLATSENAQTLGNEFGEEKLSKESLVVNSCINLSGATCFAFFCSQIVVGTNEGVQIFDSKFYEIKSELNIGKVISIDSIETALAVCTGNVIRFYDSAFSECNTITVPETVVYSRFSPEGDYFLCSCLDNKIYQFKYPSLELRVVLYGHSLPVRHFSISADQKLLVSCGADKLVKIWGLEFGECRKTIVGDSANVEFLNDTLFIFSDKELQYFNYFERLKKLKMFNPGAICIGHDYFVVGTGSGLAVFGMSKYELARDDESSELVTVSPKSIADVRDYDMFLCHLERLETDFSDPSVQEFYQFIEKLDFNELKKYLHVIDHVSIRILLEVIAQTIDLNPLTTSRMFVQLVKNHRDVAHTDTFRKIYSKMLERVRNTRELYNTSLAQLDADLSNYTID
ncbi:uncharacterized protein VICG_01786 [Vittaforma corneae ATCC 50505]|uniref:Small-subunit processome Utp21 domain-containing protein n=1 Tax=Vittaforma corneae (strain ATCC 50505) TaxID=993615 RepID=L2GLN3_VITCO|nr:uncharacterized protein VICG_01786 [Vittaforma corneae ATCC 50505]ELA41187.1 hypothetical protein VICG_01786 [Vittaforma corneae ATCC 50505]